MAGLNVITNPLAHLGNGKRMLIVGSWDCNTSSDPADLSGDLAKLGSVAHTSTGLFTYTFTKKPGEIIEAWANLRGDITNGDEVAVNAISTANGTITVTTKDSGGVTDIGSGESIRIVLCVYVNIYKNMLNG